MFGLLRLGRRRITSNARQENKAQDESNQCMSEHDQVLFRGGSAERLRCSGGDYPTGVAVSQRHSTYMNSLSVHAKAKDADAQGIKAGVDSDIGRASVTMRCILNRLALRKCSY